MSGRPGPHLVGFRRMGAQAGRDLPTPIADKILREKVDAAKELLIASFAAVLLLDGAGVCFA